MKRVTHLSIIPPTLLLAAAALLSSILGVVRDHLLAKTFGATSGSGIYNLDTYYAAFKIPDLLYLILVMGAISAAFIPIFTKYKKEKQLAEAWNFANSMLHLLLIIVSGLALLGFIFAPQLTALVAKGFEPDAFDLTVKLMRIMVLSPLIFTFSAVFISLQDSFKTFFFRSLSPIFYNLGIVLAIYYFGPQFGVVGVTWGVIVGALLSLLIQLPALPRLGYRHVWVMGYKRKDVREAFRLMIPRIMGMSMYQIAQLFYTLIASFLATGSITIMYFANNLYSLPLGIIAVSFSITSFATLSELATEKSTEPFASEIRRVMQQVLYLVFPATVGVLLLRDEIISAVLFAGKFTAGDAALTSQVLFFMIFSLFTHSLILLLTRGYYAYHDTKTPFYASLWGAVFGVLSAWFLAIKWGMGVVGLGIAISASNVLVFLLMYLFLQRRIGYRMLDITNVFKMLAASAGMGAFVWILKMAWNFPVVLADKFLYLVVVTGLGGLAYFSLSSLLKIPELEMIMRQVRRLR